MQKKVVCVAALLFFASGVLFAQNLPQPVGWVNDFANVLSADYKEKLNSLIQELEEKTSTEIAVVTIDSISPYSEIEYARLLFDNWGPGKKGKDNGVLVLLAIKERRWRIETGYGIEGILPDGLCGEIGRNYMVPYFKEGKYGQGLYQGTLKIAQVIANDTNIRLSTSGELKELPSANNAPLSPVLFVIIFFGLIIFINFLSYTRNRGGYGDNTGINYRSPWGSGWGGGFGGGGFGGGGFGGFGGGGGGGGGAGGRF
jgi:uncharacterized protein